MSNNKNNIPENDPLKGQFSGIDKQVRASAELKQAAKTGVPLRAGKNYTAGTHIRKFTQAVLLYAACIALFLGAILLIPKWWGGNEPVADPGSYAQCNHKYVELTMGLRPSCTEGNIRTYRCQYCGHSYSEQDPAPGHNFVDGICTRCGEPEEGSPLPAPIVALMPFNEAFSDEMKANVDAAYMETYNQSLEFEQTGDHEVWYLGTYDDGIVFYKKFAPPNGMHISYVDELVVADQVFSLSSYDTLCVYKDGAVKQVYDAYEDGEMSEENVLLILEQYGKLMNRLLNWSDAVRPIE